MSKYPIVKISSFLKYRDNTLSPSEANELGLQRIQKIDFNGNIFITSKSTNTKMIRIQSGDLVISGINVEKGALAVYEGNEDILATIHYSNYIFDKNKIDIDYFKLFLKSKIFIDILKDQTGAGIKTEIKPNKFLTLSVPLPTIDQQKVIIKNFYAVNKEVEEVLLQILEQKNFLVRLRKEILRLAIEGNLMPKIISSDEDENPNKSLPYNWKSSRLSSLCDREITYGIVLLGDEVPNGVNVLRCSDVKFRYIDTNNVRTVSDSVSNQYSRTILQGGEVVVNVRGTLGGCAVVPNALAGYNLAREVAIVPVKNANPYYILNVLSSPLFDKFVQSKLRGIAYKGLNIGLLSNFIVPLPPLIEQNRIVKKVDRLMAMCDELEKLIDTSKINAELLMQAVLNQAFTKKEKDNVIQFVPSVSNDYVDQWDIAAREDGDIKPETADKISAILANVGKAQK